MAFVGKRRYVEKSFDCCIYVLENRGLGEFWFKAEDVAKILEYTSLYDAIKYFVKSSSRRTLKELREIRKRYVNNDNDDDDKGGGGGGDDDDISTNPSSMSSSSSLSSSSSRSFRGGRGRALPSSASSSISRPSYSLPSSEHSYGFEESSLNETLATMTINDTLAWEPCETIFLSEAGLCSLLVNSKKYRADSFSDWVFEETLPILRRKILDKYTKNSTIKDVKEAFDSASSLVRAIFHKS